jgi:DNA-binding NarL/FixJ family response regulator
MMQFPNATAACDQEGITKGVLVVIDDEPFSRECLVEAMRSAFLDTPVVGLSLVDEVRQIERGDFALVLLRDRTYPISGRHLASEAKALVHLCPNVPVVVLSLCPNAQTVGEAITTGVRGIIPVTTSLKVAVAALRLVMVGGTYYPCMLANDVRSITEADGIGHSMISALESHSIETASNPLLRLMDQSDDMIDGNACDANVMFTARELEVLEALQKGWSNKWIAHSLHISENTIKVHIQRIMRKLHASNRTEAVVRHRQLVAAPTA